MDKYAHLEDTRQPVEHDEDAEEPTMATGLRGNPDDHKYDALRYCTFSIDRRNCYENHRQIDLCDLGRVALDHHNRNWSARRGCNGGIMNNEEYAAICRRLDDAEKTLGAVAKRLVEYQRVMKMLADEIAGIYETEYSKPIDELECIIAYRALTGDK